LSLRSSAGSSGSALHTMAAVVRLVSTQDQRRGWFAECVSGRADVGGGNVDGRLLFGVLARFHRACYRGLDDTETATVLAASATDCSHRRGVRCFGVTSALADAGFGRNRKPVDESHFRCG